MRVLIQRVRSATAFLEGRAVTAIGPGLVALVGLGRDDDAGVVDRVATKVANLRVFEHGASKFGRSVLQEDGEVLAVSQFTLYADCSRGRRPNFSGSLPPGPAQALYERFVERLRGAGVRRVTSTPFGSRLELDLRNWGPFTLLVDSDEL